MQPPQDAGSNSATGLACQQRAAIYYVAQPQPSSTPDAPAYNEVVDGQNGAAVSCKFNGTSFSLRANYNGNTFNANGNYTVATADSAGNVTAGSADNVTLSVVIGGTLYKEVSPPGCQFKIRKMTPVNVGGSFSGYFSCPQLVNQGGNPNDACAINFNAGGDPTTIPANALFQFDNCQTL